MSLVPGHALVREGAPHDERGAQKWGLGTGGRGRAKCSCGAMSEELESGAARKRWHREHKKEAQA